MTWYAPHVQVPPMETTIVAHPIKTPPRTIQTPFIIEKRGGDSRSSPAFSLPSHTPPPTRLFLCACHPPGTPLLGLQTLHTPLPPPITLNWCFFSPFFFSYQPATTSVREEQGPVFSSKTCSLPSFPLKTADREINVDYPSSNTSETPSRRKETVRHFHPCMIRSLIYMISGTPQVKHVTRRTLNDQNMGCLYVVYPLRLCFSSYSETETQLFN